MRKFSSRDILCRSTSMYFDKGSSLAESIRSYRSSPRHHFIVSDSSFVQPSRTRGRMHLCRRKLIVHHHHVSSTFSSLPTRNYGMEKWHSVVVPKWILRRFCASKNLFTQFVARIEVHALTRRICFSTCMTRKEIQPRREGGGGKLGTRAAGH